MKIEMTVAYLDGSGSSWKEDVIVEGIDPQIEGERVISRFNDTLKPGEKERRLIGVRVLDENVLKHDWQKVNLITLSDSTGYYDVWRCSRCGVEGRSYGFTGITRSARWKAKKWELCSKED